MRIEKSVDGNVTLSFDTRTRLNRSDKEKRKIMPGLELLKLDSFREVTTKFTVLEVRKPSIVVSITLATYITSTLANYF